MGREDLTVCQFCHEGGFDAPGLAQHVRTYCEVVDGLYAEQMKDLAERFNANLARSATNPGGARP